MVLYIKNKTKFRIDEKIFKRVFEKTLDFLKKKNKNVSVVVVSKNEIKKINKTWRGKNKITDVLSFSFAKDQKGVFFNEDDTEGEIFICASVAAAQAKEAGRSFKDEILDLFLHGLLHVFDFDHLNKKEAKKMETAHEKIIFKSFQQDR